MLLPMSQLMSSAAWMGLSQAAMYLAVVLGATIAIIMLLKLMMWIAARAKNPLTNAGRQRQIREQAEFNLAVRAEEDRMASSPSFRPPALRASR